MLLCVQSFHLYQGSVLGWTDQVFPIFQDQTEQSQYWPERWCPEKKSSSVKVHWFYFSYCYCTLGFSATEWVTAKFSSLLRCHFCSAVVALSRSIKKGWKCNQRKGTDGRTSRASPNATYGYMKMFQIQIMKTVHLESCSVKIILYFQGFQVENMQRACWVPLEWEIPAAPCPSQYIWEVQLRQYYCIVGFHELQHLCTASFFCLCSKLNGNCPGLHPAPDGLSLEWNSQL